MTNFRSLAAAGLLILAAHQGLPLAAADPPDAVRAFGCGRQEIDDFKNDTRRLIVEDLNNDALDDIVFLNNRMSRIEVLLRKSPPPDGKPRSLPLVDESFVSAGFLLDQKTAHLAVADLDGDRRPDLLTGGAHRGLRIYFQTAEGGFANAVSPPIKHSEQMVHVATADFDGDTAPDILLGRRRNAEILYNDGRSEERRVGKECPTGCRSRWSPYH